MFISNMSRKYDVNYWKGGSKKIFSNQVFDKKKINFLKKKKEQHAKKESYKRIHFRINKTFDELSGNKNDPVILNHFDKIKWSDFL